MCEESVRKWAKRGGWTSMTTVQKYVDETAIANAGIADSGD
jgi:hypothetical protein